MQWDRAEVRRQDVVKIQAQFVDMPDEIDIEVKIYEYSDQGHHDPVAGIPTQIAGNKIDVLWQFDYHGNTGQIPTHAELQPYNKQYSHPEYFFVIVIDGIRIGEKQESGLLKFIDYKEIEHTDCEGTPIPNEKFTAYFADGTTRQGQLDENGRARLDDVPPGEIQIEYEDGETITIVEND
jgi:hypothetical protein